MGEWFKWVGVVIGLALPLAAQVATPSFDHETGSYANSTSVWMKTATAGATICYTLDGSTPGAAVAGTCDGEPTRTFSGNNPPPIFTSGMVVNAIGTKAANANSAVHTGIYTITTTTAGQGFVNTTPVKITAASGTQVNGLPFLFYDATTGRCSLFFEQGAAAIDAGDPTVKLMLKQSADGCKTFSDWGDQSNCGAGSVSGCFYYPAVHAYWPLGGGVTPSGRWLLMVNENAADGAYTSVGVYPFYSDDKGKTWVKGVSITAGQLASFWNSPTANMVSIPQGSAGLSGPCLGATTCLIQEMLASTVPAMCISTDDGVTWPTCNQVRRAGGFVLSQPSNTEEEGVFYAGGTNLAYISRGGAVTYPAGPVQPVFASSATMGAANSWNSGAFSVGGGIQSNIPNYPCAQSPPPTWTDTFTRPVAFINPQNAAHTTLIIGERAGCNGTTQIAWKIVDFDPTSIVANGGQNFPVPQTLHLYPAAVEAGATQPHSTYFHAVPYGTNQILMAFEQGGTATCGATTCEDIMVTTLTYADTATTGVTISGGVTIK